MITSVNTVVPWTRQCLRGLERYLFGLAVKGHTFFVEATGTEGRVYFIERHRLFRLAPAKTFHRRAEGLIPLFRWILMALRGYVVSAWCRLLGTIVFSLSQGQCVDVASIKNYSVKGTDSGREEGRRTFLIILLMLDFIAPRP